MDDQFVRPDPAGGEISADVPAGLGRDLAWLRAIGDVLAAGTDAVGWADRLAAAIVERRVDWCLIDRWDEFGLPLRPAVAHRDPAAADLAVAIAASPAPLIGGPLGLPAVLRDRRPVVRDRITPDQIDDLAGGDEPADFLRRIAPRAILIVPILGAGAVRGAITCLRTAPGARFDRAEQDALAVAAALAAGRIAADRPDPDAGEATAALAAERNRLIQILDMLPEGVILTDVHGRIVSGNAAARALLGPAGSPGALTAAIRVRRIDGAVYPPLATPLARSLHQAETVRGEQLIVEDPATGRQLPLLVNSAPLRNTTGTPIGAIAVLQDISAIRDLERQKDEFLAAVSHDLKNPLATIRGLAHRIGRLAAQPDRPAERIAERATLIDQTVARATALLDEFIDIARIQMGRPLTLSRAPVDLVAIVRRAAAENQAVTDRHRLTVQADRPAIVGAWDAVRIGRVIDNLIANAIKYSPDGGPIEIVVARTDDAEGAVAVLTIRDQGIGVPAADRARIFDRFYRAGNVTDRILGTGVGLAAARQIVEQHGGTIAVASREGAGSTFTIRLPIPSEPAKPPPRPC